MNQNQEFFFIELRSNTPIINTSNNSKETNKIILEDGIIIDFIAFEALIQSYIKSKTFFEVKRKTYSKALVGVPLYFPPSAKYILFNSMDKIGFRETILIGNPLAYSIGCCIENYAQIIDIEDFKTTLTKVNNREITTSTTLPIGAEIIKRLLESGDVSSAIAFLYLQEATKNFDVSQPIYLIGEMPEYKVLNALSKKLSLVIDDHYIDKIFKGLNNCTAI